MPHLVLLLLLPLDFGGRGEGGTADGEIAGIERVVVRMHRPRVLRWGPVP